MRLMLGDEIALGPGKADLLEGIAETGSIAAAGRALDMSYKRAWMLVETMNRCFRNPLVKAGRGGRQGGGAILTVQGRKVLDAYRRMEKQADKAVAAEMRTLQRMLRDISGKQ
ncbi:MAG: LysR family transcriptional regulator [Planctomycetes bacterium]|nr:LysR family transcriptional regulator [Planctomycetota bacterium]MCW8135860.1 LysR family transcriptional regulator [Planctomycetota bacterium]